jgi:hypothetical protein
MASLGEETGAGYAVGGVNETSMMTERDIFREKSFKVKAFLYIVR